MSRALLLFVLWPTLVLASPPDAGTPVVAPKPAAPVQLSVLDDPDKPVEPPDPRHLWWTFPADDNTAVEIDSADLRAYDKPRLTLINLADSCDKKRAAKLLAARAAGATTPLRELRLDTPGQPAPRRCVNTLAAWKKRLGATLTERLEDELDAHLSFLVPRQYPKPAKPE